MAVLLIRPTTRAAYYAVTAYGEEEMRPVLEYVLERERPGDVVFVYRGFYAAFR